MNTQTMLAHEPLTQLISGAVFTLIILWLALRRPKSERRQPRLRKSLDDYLIMKREASVNQMGLSYAATMVSSLVFVGLPGLFYTHGVGSWLYFCLPVIFGVSTLFWFGSRISVISRKIGANSPFDMMNHIYKSRWIGVAAFALTVIFVVPVVAMQMVAIGRLLQSAGLAYEVGVLAILLIFLAYTLFAGMRGDVRTDMYQGWLMVVGMFFVLGSAIWLAVQSDTSIIASAGASEAHYSLPGPRSLFALPNTISLAIMLYALPLMHGHYIMRAMIAKKDEYVGQSMWISSLIIFLLYICAAGIGLIGLGVAPGLESGDLLTGTLLYGAEQSLGFVGALLGGLILAGVAAAALSSVDSQFLALGASAARDVLGKAVGLELSEVAQLRVIRLVMTLVGFCAVIMALDPPPLIVQLAVFATSGTMALVPTFAGAVLLRRPPRASWALVSIGTGFFVFSLLMITVGVEYFWGWHPGVIAFAVSLFIYGLGALIAPMPEQSVEPV